MRPKPGDVVTCKIAVEAYYSRYGGNPKITFEPGMEAVVHCLAPKVALRQTGPEHDKNPLFVVADYEAPETGRKERLGLHFCNCVRVRKGVPPC